MAKKTILIVVGLFALLSGLAVTTGGAALLALGGRSGTIQSGYHAVSTQTVAFVSDPAEIRDTSNVDIKAGTATLKVDAHNSLKPLFIGVGPSDRVAAYLANSPYETVTKIDFSPFNLTTSQSPGASQPAAPAGQSFWVAQAVGLSPELSWSIAGDSYRVVVMNADSSPGVGLDTRVGLQVPALYHGSLAVTIGGGLFALLGLGLLSWGIAAKRNRPAVGAVYPGRYAPSAGRYPPATHPPAMYPPATYPPATNYPPADAGSTYKSPVSAAPTYPPSSSATSSYSPAVVGSNGYPAGDPGAGHGPAGPAPGLANPPPTGLSKKTLDRRFQDPPS